MTRSVVLLDHGFAVRAHANALARLPTLLPNAPSVERSILVGRDPDRAAAAAARLGSPARRSRPPASRPATATPTGPLSRETRAPSAPTPADRTRWRSVATRQPGSRRWPSPTPAVHTPTGGGRSATRSGESAAFLGCVAAGEPFRPSFADGLAVQRVLGAVERAAAEGSWVAV